MSDFIEFSNHGNNEYSVRCYHPDFGTSDFSFELGGYGQYVKRISINLIDLNTGITYPFASSNFETLRNKMNSKISRLLNEKLKKSGLEKAQKMNEEATKINTFLESPLKYLSSHCKRQELEYFLREDIFEEKEPAQPLLESFREPPIKPNKSLFKPKVNIFHLLFGMRDKQIIKSRQKYRQSLRSWEENMDSYLEEEQEHKLKQEHLKNEYETQLKNFQSNKRKFESEKESFNKEVLNFKFLNKDSDEKKIESYFNLLLGKFELNDWFSIDSLVFYENGTLIINTELPHIDDIPKIKSVRFVQTRNEIKETFISKTDESKYYNNLIFSLCLFQMKRAVMDNYNKLFTNIAVNGFVEGRNKSTGKMERNCIVSVLAEHDVISEINFEYVEPKACFKSLKGRNGAKLIDEIPVQPIIQTSKDDGRFIDAVDNLDSLDSEFNLASMDWMEFEHLVREIFEKEFSKDGGEVKVTQSSRDGGVDAIAFDPDPIRGGKIVIQAKRYTNVVGVSNVRDLYGTVINEGANRGVLITTSDFGSDSHNFVKDKPISLINGNNLLFLLNKYGYNAKIDIKEAKRILKERGE